jgi:hypothetical protein
VTSGGARRGRRDNGLVAAVYAAAGDVDPRVGEHLLDVLAVQGIAAYLQPAADLHPVTRTTTLPSRPTDRLFVDREHLATARGFLAQLAEETPATEPDFDELFAGIVADFETATAAPTWPAAEDLDTEESDTADDAGPDGEPAPHPGRLKQWRSSTVDPTAPVGAGRDEYADDEDEDEGYTPPPPPPLPRISLITVAAVVAIVAGFVLFFNPGMLPISAAASLVIGFAAILAGFATLVWRLRSGDDDDDWDPDDGAVV